MKTQFGVFYSNRIFKIQFQYKLLKTLLREIKIKNNKNCTWGLGNNSNLINKFVKK